MPPQPPEKPAQTVREPGVNAIGGSRRRGTREIIGIGVTSDSSIEREACQPCLRRPVPAVAPKPLWEEPNDPVGGVGHSITMASHPRTQPPVPGRRALSRGRACGRDQVHGPARKPVECDRQRRADGWALGEAVRADERRRLQMMVANGTASFRRRSASRGPTTAPAMRRSDRAPRAAQESLHSVAHHGRMHRNRAPAHFHGCQRSGSARTARSPRPSQPAGRVGPPARSAIEVGLVTTVTS